MKKSLKVLSLFLLLSLALTLSACKKIEILAPEITLDETVVSWEAVENATGYKVIVNEQEYEITATSYDLKDFTEASYEITVIALGDGKKINDSLPSNVISITPTNKAELQKGEVISGKLQYKVKVQSNAGVFGFTFDISYPTDKLTITSESLIWNSIPDSWVYDAKISDGLIKIAITGLDPINVRLLQTVLTLEFNVNDGTGSAKLDSFAIDND